VSKVFRGKQILFRNETFSLLIKPCVLQYFLWILNSSSPESVFMFLVYVVCACGLFLHIGHCVGFFILSSSCKTGRWSTFFFRNRSEYLIV
jgi:hypothetical protein